jgi:hypothetical protein
MKHLLQLEEAGLCAVAVFGLYLQPIQFSWWVWIILFLLPDLGILGYLHNPKTGAFTYNLLHHRFIGVAILVYGYFTHNQWLVLAGLIVLGHSSFDRTVGYGLKFTDNFKHTHLGWIGKAL